MGLQTNIIKCIGTTGTAWLGTNALAGVGVPIAGINLKQAGAMFAVHIGFEVFTYMKNSQPQVITETEETQHFNRTAGGAFESGSSKTVTVTPISAVENQVATPPVQPESSQPPKP